MEFDKEREDLKERKDTALAQVKSCAERAYKEPEKATAQLRALARVNPSGAASEIEKNPHKYGEPKPGATLWREHAYEAVAAALAEARLNLELTAFDLKHKFHEKQERERDDERDR